MNYFAIFNLIGDAKFYYCDDKDKRNSQEFDTSPGSLVLLRGAKNKDEQRYRPYHYIMPMKSERLSLNVRKKSELFSST